MSWLERYAKWVSHSLETQLAAGSVLSQIQDAETGERGYVLTGQDAFLEPYLAAAARIKTSFDRLRKLTFYNPVEQGFSTGWGRSSRRNSA